MVKYDCVCYNIKKETITKAIDDNDIKDIKSLHPHCHAGYACGRCLPYIENYIKSRSEKTKT